jgi:hypothetical protein
MSTYDRSSNQIPSHVLQYCIPICCPFRLETVFVPQYCILICLYSFRPLVNLWSKNTPHKVTRHTRPQSHKDPLARTEIHPVLRRWPLLFSPPPCCPLLLRSPTRRWTRRLEPLRPCISLISHLSLSCIASSWRPLSASKAKVTRQSITQSHWTAVSSARRTRRHARRRVAVTCMARVSGWRPTQRTNPVSLRP